MVTEDELKTVKEGKKRWRKHLSSFSNPRTSSFPLRRFPTWRLTASTRQRTSTTSIIVRTLVSLVSIHFTGGVQPSITGEDCGR